MISRIAVSRPPGVSSRIRTSPAPASSAAEIVVSTRRADTEWMMSTTST